MLLKKHKNFLKSFEVLPHGIQKKVIVVLELFATDWKHPSLYNHALQGKRKGCRNINVTGDYRIIFRELSDGMYELVELVQVGTYSQLYG